MQDICKCLLPRLSPEGCVSIKHFIQQNTYSITSTLSENTFTIEVTILHYGNMNKFLRKAFLRSDQLRKNCVPNTVKFCHVYIYLSSARSTKLPRVIKCTDLERRITESPPINGTSMPCSSDDLL